MDFTLKALIFRV